MTQLINYFTSPRRGIKREIELVNQKEQRNAFERYAKAMEEEDEVLECYRRIQRLLERLTVCIVLEYEHIALIVCS
jgi:ribosome assembly protein YihI (activator of Der GTPase)